jgi:hypothetical protein
MSTRIKCPRLAGLLCVSTRSVPHHRPPKPKPPRTYDATVGPPCPGMPLCFPAHSRVQLHGVGVHGPYLLRLPHEVATSDICKVVPPDQHPSRCVKHEAAVIAPSRPQDVRCQVQWHHRRLLQPSGRRRVDTERETCIDRAGSGAAPRQLARASVSPHLAVPAVPCISVEVRLLDAYMR